MTRFISPSVARAAGSGSRRLYSFQDLLAIRVARQLRQAGVSLQALRKVARHLRARKGLEQPLAETYLVTDGREVLEKNGDDLVSVLRQPGQKAFLYVVNLQRAVDDLHQAVLRLGIPFGGEGGRRVKTGGG